jgi:hypothetical protein
MAGGTVRTAKKDEIFMAQLSQHGRSAQASRVAGYTRSRVYAWRKDDAAFAQAWDDALATYTERLEQEADRRAVEGTLKPVYYLGEKCGEIRQYSDTLLIFRLKALKPDVYRDAPKTPAPTPPAEGAESPKDLLNRIRTEIYNLDAQA